MSLSLYMIKPEAMMRREEIRACISRRLVLSEVKTMRLPDWALDELYDDLTVELRSATRIALTDSVELGLVSGEDAITELLQLAGENTSPSECHPDSIRYRFGVHQPMMLGGATYFLNAIHRPKSSAEAAAHIALFGKL